MVIKSKIIIGKLTGSRYDEGYYIDYRDNLQDRFAEFEDMKIKITIEEIPEEVKDGK